MATWIAHLRIAEALLNKLTDFDQAMFVSGSIAPDCGLLNEDRASYTPPREITHYYRAPGELHDMLFFHEYLAGQNLSSDPQRISYLWGYFLHLVSDVLWYLRLANTTKEQYPSLFADKGDQAWWVVKEDWYDLDHQYLRDHPDNLFSKLFICLPDPPQYLAFLPAEGIRNQFAHIRDYYGNARLEKGLDRLFPYLNETTMRRFITDTVYSLEKLYIILQQPLPGNTGDISLGLMSPEEYAPIPPPLGDPE
jgi:hypothetical protein